jgi:hypothetical protein
LEKIYDEPSRLYPGAKAVLASLVRLLRGASTRRAPKAPTARAHKLHGFEIFPGIGTPISRTTRYGATFVAVERGETSVVMIGWVNYAPIFFKPETECTVVGGRWWLVTSKGARYRGMLYGPFTKGRVRWNKNAKLAEVSVRLKVSGGTKACRNALSVGNLTAVLNHLPFPPSPPRIGGTLELSHHEE